MQTTIDQLTQSWIILFPAIQAPDSQQWMIWLLRHDVRVVRDAIARLAIKRSKMDGPMSFEHMVKHASATMTRLSEEKAKAA